MLTIGQLAAYAGTTVRAVRHYHAIGLLPEPERDHSGYRRYGAAAAVELVRIRTLADAGVPLARVRELLDSGPAEFEAAVGEIDRRLRAEIRALQEHRERIAQLSAGDRLALPAEAVAYLDRMRELGFAAWFVAGERDAWILVAAQLPDQMPLYMRLKQAQLDDPENVEVLRSIADTIDGEVDDARLAELADRLAAAFDESFANDPDSWTDVDLVWPPKLVALLDSFFLESVPFAEQLLRLLEERGWRGWTKLEPVSTSRARP